LEDITSFLTANIPGEPGQVDSECQTILYFAVAEDDEEDVSLQCFDTVGWTTAKASGL